jgi:hypothetical protein
MQGMKSFKAKFQILQFAICDLQFAIRESYDAYLRISMSAVRDHF